MKSPSRPLTLSQLFDYRIVAALKAYHGPSYKPILKTNIGFSNSFEKLTVTQVNQGVTALIAALNFGGGSGLYEILQAVLLDQEKREEIQDLLKGWMPPMESFG